jgi:CDP-diglyceride synthetase
MNLRPLAKNGFYTTLFILGAYCFWNWRDAETLNGYHLAMSAMLVIGWGAVLLMKYNNYKHTNEAGLAIALFLLATGVVLLNQSFMHTK